MKVSLNVHAGHLSRIADDAASTSACHNIRTVSFNLF
jgi:hypothetical protein